MKKISISGKIRDRYSNSFQITLLSIAVILSIIEFFHIFENLSDYYPLLQLAISLFLLIILLFLRGSSYIHEFCHYLFGRLFGYNSKIIVTKKIRRCDFNPKDKMNRNHFLFIVLAPTIIMMPLVLFATIILVENNLIFSAWVIFMIGIQIIYGFSGDIAMFIRVIIKTSRKDYLMYKGDNVWYVYSK